MGDEVKDSAQKDGGLAELESRRSDSRPGYARVCGNQLAEFEEPVRMGINGEQILHVPTDVRPPPKLMAPHHQGPIVHAFPDVNNVQARKCHIVWAGSLYKVTQGTVNHKASQAARYFAAEVETLDPYLVVGFQVCISLITQQMPTEEAAAELRQ